MGLKRNKKKVLNLKGVTRNKPTKKVIFNKAVEKVKVIPRKDEAVKKESLGVEKPKKK